MATGCKSTWVSAIRPDEISEDIQQAIFGYGKPRNYDEWKSYPKLVAMCKKHYRMVKHKDGYTLGYRKVNGRTVAYVKEEHF